MELYGSSIQEKGISKIALVVILSICISGCVVQVLEPNHLAGDCYEVRSKQYLFHGRANAYRGQYMLVSNVKAQAVREMKLVGSVESGELLGVKQILKSWNGSWGEFLRVRVKVLSGTNSGVIADIPVHAPYHPREKWTKSFTLDPNVIEFNEDIVTPCD